MQDDRSGLVLPAVLAAWLIGVVWALVGLGTGETASDAASASVSPAEASGRTSPPIEVVEEYDPPRLVTFVEDGEYVGLRFDTSGRVTDEHRAVATAGSTAPASKLIRVHGSPYILLVDGTWVEWYIAAELVHFADDD